MLFKMIITLFTRLYVQDDNNALHPIVMVGILLTCGMHLHDSSISPRETVWARKTSLTPPLFIDVSVPSQESKQSCICVLCVSILSISAIFLKNVGNVPAVWYFWLFTDFIQAMYISLSSLLLHDKLLVYFILIDPVVNI